MGGGSWNPKTYTTRNLANTNAGYASSFTHHEDIAAGRKALGAHESMDPKLKNSDKSVDHPNMNIREALDSDEHPNATAIAVLFDVTGSMGRLPGVLQTKLPELHGLLQRKGYVEDPQIMFGGIGDAYSDRVPLQIGQFESDNTMDENLGNIFLEGGGGGGNHESYALAAYFLAYHTFIDSVKKRDKKGYAFLIGDERLYEGVTKKEVEQYIGLDQWPDKELTSLSTKAIFEKLQESYDVYFLFASQGSYGEESVLPADAGAKAGSYGAPALGWRAVLEQTALVLEDANAVCETIALTLGVMEGAVSYEDGLDDLDEMSDDKAAVAAAGKALATVGANATVPAEASASLPEIAEDTDQGVDRL